MSRDTIRLPHDAYRLLQTLRAAGHSAYVVGGCVRDSLLGRLPGDWDICTSARPDEMKALFCSQRLILTGEKHGTVAVILHGKPYEMTTYRLDGSYRDHRHPDNVQFVDDLAADLARRDFTINAMAYTPGEGVIDLYGGRSDLAASECPKDAVECSLWQILQATAPSRYSLSQTACLGILRRAACRGKSLPPLLEAALRMQAGLDPPAPISGEAKAYHINQRNEGIDLDGVSGALMATQNLQMQTFITNPGSSQSGPKKQIAFAANQRDEVRDLHDVAGALQAQPGIKHRCIYH